MEVATAMAAKITFLFRIQLKISFDRMRFSTTHFTRLNYTGSTQRWFYFRFYFPFEISKCGPNCVFSIENAMHLIHLRLGPFLFRVRAICVRHVWQQLNVRMLANMNGECVRGSERKQHYKQHQFWFMIKLSVDSPVLLQIEQKPICKANDDKLHIVHRGWNAAQRFFVCPTVFGSIPQLVCMWWFPCDLYAHQWHKQSNRYIDIKLNAFGSHSMLAKTNHTFAMERRSQ